MGPGLVELLVEAGSDLPRVWVLGSLTPMHSDGEAALEKPDNQGLPSETPPAGLARGDGELRRPQAGSRLRYHARLQ